MHHSTHFTHFTHFICRTDAMMSNRINRAVRACALAALTLAAGAASAQQAGSGTDRVVDPTAARQQAQEIAQGDPPRWYRNDSEQQTLRKEIGAALQEAQNACRQQPAGERKACMQEARSAWQRDMAQLRPAGQQ